MGATRCSIPQILNKNILKLPATGTDKNIKIAEGYINLDYITLPELSLVYRIGRNIRYYSIKNVDAWLGKEDYLVGMNFLRALNISMNNDILTIKLNKKRI